MIKEFNPALYDKIMKPSIKSKSLYGVSEKTNKAGQVQMMKDTEAVFSMFDNDAFLFYLLKYAEILGIQTLI
jgi:hypothetical protein